MKFNKYICILIGIFFFSCKKDDVTVKSVTKTNPLVWKTYSNDIYGFCNSQYIPLSYFGAFALDKNNEAWLPVVSGIASFNQANLTNYPGFSDTTSGYILIDKSNNVWIGGWHGLNKFNGTSWQSYILPPTALAINTQCIDSAGNIWGTYDTSIARFDGSNWKTIKNPAGCTSNFYRGVNINRKGQIWAGTGNGIGIVWIENDTAHYVPNFIVKNSADSTKWYTDFPTSVNDVQFDVNDNLWVACGRGVFVYDGIKWRGYNKTNSGLIDNDVYGIAFDKHGCVWIATYSGLQRLYNNTWSNYYTPFNTCMSQSNYGWKERITYIKVDKNDCKWMLSYQCGMAVLVNE
ncbi:MAG TPA: two-component regulator propeller domain-containing protein [Bacteroidia bacterium]|jgi:ligand-binding sensor domain-containing protein|nr:two-component regulator propeller domain-containing protein [Bacteroidia bacterium]